MNGSSGYLQKGLLKRHSFQIWHPIASTATVELMIYLYAEVAPKSTN